MRFTVILVICLVIASACALKTKKMTSATANRLNEIKKTNSWASILLNLAELHMTAKGPLDDLVAAIEDTVQDLQYKREKRDEAYVKRTEEHDALVQQLTSDIARCEADIAETNNVLDMLAEQKASLEEENREAASLIEDTTAAIAEATRVRQLQHEEFETKIAETNEAVEAVEECLTILNELAFGGASFAQIKNAKSKLSLAQVKIAKTKTMESAFLNALVQVAASADFADASALNQVIAKFNEIKNNLYDSIGKLTADEELAQSAHEKFLADSKQTIFEAEELIDYDQGLLVENAKNTVENQTLLANLEADKAEFERQLDEENESYESYVERYEAWCEENDREVAVCQEALEVVSTVDLADYISDRVNAEDGLVSSGMATTQQHGMGTEVFNFDYQF